jgi:hypothetical protein
VSSFYIVLQEKVPGVDGAKLEARSLSKHISKLDVVAKQEGVKPLSSFFSAAREEVAGLLDGEPPDFDIPEEQWFAAEDGLKTIAALLKGLDIKSSPTDSPVANELANFRKVLEAAQFRNVRWHLGIDY